MNYPLVTIGIPTYNRADDFLRDAVQSALDQTYPNIEVIISDNCSSDDTENVIKSFKDPRIRYIRHNVNIGANNNFNYCLKQAKGTYFLLLHSDDMIDRDFIETCMNASEGNHEIGVIRTGIRLIDEDSNLIIERTNQVGGCSNEDFILGWFANKTGFYFCSTLYNTSRLKKIGGFYSKTNLYQDAVAIVKLAFQYGRVDVFDVKASFRKQSISYGSNAKVADWCIDRLYLLEIICDLAIEKKHILRDEGLDYFLRQSCINCSDISSHFKRLIAYATIGKIFKDLYPLKFMYNREIKRRIRHRFFDS